jgi:ABC-type glycerol-3-phosphate transport system substrate-binding protein
VSDTRPMLTLRDLAAQGFTATLEADGHLAIQPAERLTVELKAQLYHWRHDLKAEALLHQPRPVPWDEAVAEALLRRTVEALGRLRDVGAALGWAQQRRPSLIQNLQQAEAAIDTAFDQADLLAVREACLRWWQAWRQLVAECALPHAPEAQREVQHAKG